MNDKKEDFFIDADYVDIEETSNKKEIRGEPLFYTTTQVATLLNEEPSCIRYWTKRFQKLLKVEISNKNRQYKKTDIEKLRFIKKLIREDHLTLQQVEDYTSAKEFDIKDIEKRIIDSDNPLAIRSFVSTLTVDIDEKLNRFSEELIATLDDKLKSYSIAQNEMHEKLKENIVLTVDEVVSEKLEENSQDIKLHIDQTSEITNQIQQDNKKLLEEVTVTVSEIKNTNDKLAKILDDPEALKELIRKQRKSDERKQKGLLSKLFGK